MERQFSASMVTPRLNADHRGRHCSISCSNPSVLPSSGTKMNLPKLNLPRNGGPARPIGCVGFRGNNRLLFVVGLIVLICYIMSELVLRSWTLDDPNLRYTHDCLSTHSVNPSSPESPCGHHAHVGVKVEMRTNDAVAMEQRKMGDNRVQQLKQHDGIIDSVDSPQKSNHKQSPAKIVISNNEIDVDSSDLQPRNTVHRRSVVHRNPARLRNINNPDRTVPVLRDGTAFRTGSRSPEVQLMNISQRKSLWTLWEGSKNGSHLEYLSKDVLRYRNALQEKLRGSTMSPAMVAMEKRYYARNPKRINPHDFTVMLNASSVCEDVPFLVVIIPSLPSSRDRRNAIRETWGSVSTNNTWPNEALKEKVKVAFLLGRTESFHVRMVIRQENEQFKDIIQEDFLESYRNLSLKTVMGIKWVLNHCNRARYVMKCDDDMIAHIPMILKMLSGHKYHNTIIGHINKGAVVQRQGLWALSTEEFPFDHFPPYASGTAYIISADLIKPLYEMSEHVALVPIEDAYVTGILARMVGASLIHRNGFTSWNSFSPRTCDLILGRIFTGTKMTSNSLRRMWQRIKTGGPNCSRDAPNIVMARMSRNE